MRLEKCAAQLLIVSEAMKKDKLTVYKSIKARYNIIKRGKEHEHLQRLSLRIV